MTLSHNVYSVAEDSNLKNLCNYLIKIDLSPTNEEIIPCNSISQVIEICANEKRFCRVYQKNSPMSKTWNYLCDISKEVIWKNG